jgi:hypothetical protein
MTGSSVISVGRVYKMSRRARFFSLLLLLLGVFSSVEFLTGALPVNFRHIRLLAVGGSLVGSRCCCYGDYIYLENYPLG